MIVGGLFGLLLAFMSIYIKANQVIGYCNKYSGSKPHHLPAG